MALERCLPGKLGGCEIEGWKQIEVSLNGHLARISLAVMIFTPNFDGEGSASGTLFDLSYVYDHYIHLATAALVIAVVMTVYLYVRLFVRVLSWLHGDSGNFVYDAFIGRELNFRVLKNFDLKYFFRAQTWTCGMGIDQCGVSCEAVPTSRTCHGCHDPGESVSGSLRLGRVVQRAC